MMSSIITFTEVNENLIIAIDIDYFDVNLGLNYNKNSNTICLTPFWNVDRRQILE